MTTLRIRGVMLIKHKLARKSKILRTSLMRIPKQLKNLRELERAKKMMKEKIWL